MFQVEWAESVPVDESGDAVLDCAEYRQKYFTSHKTAWAFAKKVYPKDWFGSVCIAECHEEPYEPGLPGTYLEYDGDAEHYEGE